ncbi:DUF86 domain-containing protein [Oscillatoria sp. CS-180]|uniref:HepT-like ribonuclease domain-containing protein n=1 Tax=Oscillatoria sp. CS-180 TaxID=3021720 RepID=UPI00232D2F20|nr:DUF86 domain-containing protein [Oscillatoria sp. CS-180]MDB9526001.1 DUF86 domain-containing protein [Oscillatoria sp. CS-180]
MSSRDWQQRVQDILTAIDSIQNRLQGLSFEDFVTNDVLVESVLYQLIVIGEAAINIPSAVKAENPKLPWRKMSDMRNIMAHEYFRVEMGIVWETVQTNLPPLIEPLNALLDIDHERKE